MTHYRIKNYLYRSAMYSFLSASLARARAATDHFFFVPRLPSCPPIAKRTHVLLAFPHTYVLLSPDFADNDNTCAF